VVNEGWRFGGYGAELAATVGELAFGWLDAPVARLGALDMPVPYSQPLELATIPDAARIASAARDAVRAGHG
jgi:pyruvate dehydrogenase E1 component beta subunit